ncbi:regulator of chromosome condensation 1/beta-lactamase-inhibitor protein II [Amylocarpus encephaloides]|uniref:Regulator of chromosome condensation 1/beta-lactamase-inhibitor protein II n=1 Tax=Amylocarpus encephaloides TaxID=45428 RepID=A0A9P7YB87_9HELO|nr:regulator of chromosome condensation 1/beta-lactamase-inhibitor protein II [Amylocarpus encephaloides]
MELWVCGFNAWGQLEFEKKLDWSDPPKDFVHFQKALVDEQIEFVQGRAEWTLVKTSSGHRVSGHPNARKDDALLQLLLDAPSSLVASNDTETWLVSPENPSTVTLSHTYNNNTPEPSHTLPSTISQLLANSTAFQALTATGDVYSWGQARFPHLLGRDITPGSPAGTPCPVTSLQDLPTGPIRHVASGPNMTAAITTGNDLYIYGQRSEGPGLIPMFDEGGMLDGDVQSVDVGGHDVREVTCGKNHMLVLTMEDRLFVMGTNGSGQLGLGEGVKCEEWREVKLPLGRGLRIVSLHTGYKNSFAVVDKI